MMIPKPPHKAPQLEKPARPNKHPAQSKFKRKKKILNSNIKKKQTHRYKLTIVGAEWGRVTAVGDLEIQTTVRWKIPRRGKIPRRR